MLLYFLDEIFTPEDDQDVFSNKSENLFNEGKNLFSDEVSTSSWKNKPVKPVNKNIIPPSIDVPPPLSNFCKNTRFFTGICQEYAILTY